MKRISAILLAGVAAFAVNATAVGLVPSAASETTVVVGGAPMYPSKNIVQNAINSKDHTTLIAAVKAAGLVHSGRPGTVHGIRADQRCIRQATGRHSGDAA